MRAALGFLHVADERFSLVHGNVRIGYERRQLIDNVSRSQTLITSVPRHADLVDEFALDHEGPHSARDIPVAA